MKVLVTATNYSKLCPEAKLLLEQGGCEVIENPHGRPFTFAELKEQVADIDAAIAGVDSWSEDIFKLAPKLKIIARFGVGVDNIDLAKAREYGIQVTNVPGKNANAVAELTIGFILGSLRNIPALHHSTRAGGWDRFVGMELAGRTIGFLGFGNIARKIAYKLQGFDVQLLAFDKFPNLDAAREHNVTMASLEQVLRQSDIVSMLLPSLPETYHLMGREQFAMMKQTAYFINTARGVLVDEAALYEALTNHTIAGAAIDVYEQEPTAADHPLFGLDNIITTPHTAGETYETYHAVSLITAQAVLDVFAGKTPDHSLQ
jgi:D-3-phosphoglycerate dehydrogenase